MELQQAPFEDVVLPPGWSEPEPGAFDEGSIVGRYRLCERTASGSTSDIHRAEHLELRRSVAFKVLHPLLHADPMLVEKFREEAVSLSRIHHQHVVDVVDVGQVEADRHYFVMEFVEGHTLADTLRREGALTPVRAARLVIQIAQGLSAVHEVGLAHQDLRPENIMVTRRNDAEYVKIIDFGVAKSPLSDLVVPVELAGTWTPRYLAPELESGRSPNACSDVYSLGLILYELLVGKPAFLGSSGALAMLRQLSDPTPELPRRFPSALRELVPLMLEKDPRARLCSTEEVALRLDEFVSAEQSALRVPVRSRVVQTGLWCLVAAALTLGARELVAHTRRGRFAPPAAASSPGDARLSVWSSPSGAQVFEGAQLAGTTPLTLSRPSGRVELTFRYDGFATETRTFELVAGANSQVISLSPQPP